MAYVTCHMSRVTCHVSYVTFFIFFLGGGGQSGEVYRWSVCYRRGLPRLIFVEEPFHLIRYLEEYPASTQIQNIQTAAGGPFVILAYVM